MALTNAGRDFMAQAIINDGSPIFFSNALAHIGVGDSSTPFDETQTDLQAGTNKLRKGMDTAFPTRTNNQLVFKSVFGETEANFAWNEWAIFNDPAAGTMLSRKVENLGVKNGGTWILTATATLNIG